MAGQLFRVSKSIVIFLFIFSGLSFSTSCFAKDTVDWKWPGGNKAPSWWTWGDKYSGETPKKGGYLRLWGRKYIGLMNPNHFPVNDWAAMTYIYDALINQDASFKPSVPWMIESWKHTNALTVIMKVRKGITFHDGSVFNAEALKYNIDWIKDKRNGCWSRAWLEPVKSIEVIDEYTVKWNFANPLGSFEGLLASPVGYAVSKEALEKDLSLYEANKLKGRIGTYRKKLKKAQTKADSLKGKADKKYQKALAKVGTFQKKLKKLEQERAFHSNKSRGHRKTDVHPVGAGRFMLEDAKPGNYLKLKRNPNWWFAKKIGKDMPYFDGVIVKVIPDPAVTLATARAGKIDLFFPQKHQYSMLKRDPKFIIQAYTGPHFNGMMFNHAKGPCKDIRVRKAISHAIDRRAIVIGTQFGLCQVASGPYPGAHWAHNPNLKPLKYDPKLAKKLLAEAGYPNGLKLNGYVINNPNQQNNALAEKQMLSKVGIDWQYDVLEPATAEHRSRNLDFDLVSSFYMWIFDPDAMSTAFYTKYGGRNHGRTNNPKAEALIKQARQETDMAKRQKLYWQVEKALYDNYEDVWVYWPKDLWAFSKNLAGWNDKFYRTGGVGYWASHPMWFRKQPRSL